MEDVLARQCLERRIPDQETLKREIAAWEESRNRARATVDWRFTITDARSNLSDYTRQSDCGGLLAPLEQLEKAVANNWLLTTADVKRVIGVKPTGDSFTRGSFTFIRAGKIGNQSAWKVIKSFV